jgi:transposase-like protein
VIDVFVDELDVGELGFSGVDPEVTGRPSHHPSVLWKLYGYLNRVRSSRRLEREAGRNVEGCGSRVDLFPITRRQPTSASIIAAPSDRSALGSLCSVAVCLRWWRPVGGAVGQRMRSSRLFSRALQAPRQVSATARRYGISRSLLLQWRRSFRAEHKSPAEQQIGFAPAIVVTESKPAVPAPAGLASGGAIEIELRPELGCGSRARSTLRR